MAFKKPMKAPIESVNTVANFFGYFSWPQRVSLKLDGIRLCSAYGAPFSSTLKMHPNKQVGHAITANPNVWNKDIEIIVGDPTSNPLNRTSGFCRSNGQETDDLRFYIFDNIDDDVIDLPFEDRYKTLLTIRDTKDSFHNLSYSVLQQIEVHSLEELLEIEDRAVKDGYEGVMSRNPKGRYKAGRATLLEDLIFKVKRMDDMEGILVDVEEGETNTNEQKVNELGLLKRSTMKDGMVPNGRVGTFIVSYKGEFLRVAKGRFSQEQLKEIWENKSRFLGRALKFQTMVYGMKDVPRFARAVAFREPFDM